MVWLEHYAPIFDANVNAKFDAHCEWALKTGVMRILATVTALSEWPVLDPVADKDNEISNVLTDDIYPVVLVILFINQI